MCDPLWFLAVGRSRERRRTRAVRLASRPVQELLDTRRDCGCIAHRASRAPGCREQSCISAVVPTPGARLACLLVERLGEQRSPRRLAVTFRNAAHQGRRILRETVLAAPR